MLQHKLKILALSGSLRASSSNAVILEAIERMLPEDIDFFIYKGIGSLPHFDDAEQVPIAVTVWRKHLQDADAVLICSPEYAFGIPGSLKNALDWTVSSGELVNKPLALITAATGGEKAHAAWLQVFTALSARIPAGGALLIPFVRSKLGANGSITDEGTRQAVEQLLHNLIATAKESVA
ncbi:MAG TPA: NADPH-dependent FMN reductase [Chitinophagaceae bacterium]|nr:NADPH-dependent FMN reductase [Chitinophagaceae bacterium]